MVCNNITNCSNLSPYRELNHCVDICFLFIIILFIVIQIRVLLGDVGECTHLKDAWCETPPPGYREKTLCPQQMLVHKGGQINNVQLITGLRIAEMSQLQNYSVKCTKNGSYCENVKKGRKSQGEGGCVQRMEVIVKRKKKLVGGGGVGGICERRSEAFV